MHKLHLAAFEHGSWKGSVPDQTIQKQWRSEKKNWNIVLIELLSRWPVDNNIWLLVGISIVSLLNIFLWK